MPYMPGDLSGRMRNFLPSTIALPTRVRTAQDPEEELREQEIRVVPAAARREESHVPWLAILLCALFLAGGAWYFRDSIPGLSSNTVSREKNGLAGCVFSGCP